MRYFSRAIEVQIQHALKRRKSVLLLGPRQTGKTTLLQRLSAARFISFAQVNARQQYEKNPDLLRGEIEVLALKSKRELPLVVIDEVQKVPLVLDVAQDLIDRKIAKFILSGSSARKLKRGSEVNLLPGRVVCLRLDPMTYHEYPDSSLTHHLLYGSLPGIATDAGSQDKETDLSSYVTAYLEEEVRAEALVRNLGSFARFLELAASDSGQIVNFKKLSQEIGVADTTIRAYYQILEDCLIAERIDPLTKSKTRRKLTKTSKYVFFDLGVRRKAAQEGRELPREVLGHLFEQWVGLELLRCARLSGQTTKIRFWRDPSGPETDWVIQKEASLIPVEVKWTASPRKSDVKHLRTFLREYENAPQAYLICQVERKARLDEEIFAIPWYETGSLVLK